MPSLPEKKVNRFPCAAKAFLPLLLLMIALVFMLLAVMACGADEPATVEPAATTSELKPEDIRIPPPTPPPGRAADPATAATGVNDSIQQQLEAILSTYSLDYQYSVIAELASDRYQGRRTGSDGARSAATFIAAEYQRLGLVPWTGIGLQDFYHHFAAAGLEDDNVIGVLPGSNPDGDIIILAAHYDHLGLDANGEAFNGADDNAAGVATVMEAAAILQALGLRPANTVVFCAFSGEEQGQYGAMALGQLLTNSGLAGKVEVINIDGIGATGGNYLGVWDEGSAAAAPLVETMSHAGSYLGVSIINEGTDIGSDAQPFAWDYGIPAVTVDWDWGSDPSVFHPYYHTIYDDADAIDKPTLARATRVILVGFWLRVSS